MVNFRQDLKSDEGVLGKDTCVSPLRFERSVVVYLNTQESELAKTRAMSLAAITGWVVRVMPYGHNGLELQCLHCSVQQGWGSDQLLSTDLFEWRALAVRTVKRVIPEAKYWE